MVLVAPVPLATTPLPVKFKVVAAVDNDEPSSWTVRDDEPLPPLAVDDIVPSAEMVMFVPCFTPPSVDDVAAGRV